MAVDNPLDAMLVVPTDLAILQLSNSLDVR